VPQSLTARPAEFGAVETSGTQIGGDDGVGIASRAHRIGGSVVLTVADCSAYGTCVASTLVVIA